MNILHYHSNDSTSQQNETLQLLRDRHYDLLHIHGCWQYQSWRIARLALKKGVRLVFSPEGQLEPWVMNEAYWKEKLPKKLLYQRWIVRHAYVVVIQGKMEEECMRRLGWNSRLEIIRNPEITNTITQQEANKRHNILYRKVMDTFTYELIPEQIREMIRQLIKAGITGDTRWTEGDMVTLDQEQWRQLLCFAHQEQITDVVMRGANLFRLQVPYLDMEQIDWFKPENYEQVQSIESVIGSSFASENDRLIATFRLLRKLITRRRLCLAHLVELDKELRFHHIEEERLCEELEYRHLQKWAARLMQVMAEVTGLTEGFMPVPPLNDRLTRQLRRQVENRLRIVN